MSEARDLQVVKDAERALDLLFDKYVEAEPADQWLLKPAISKASEELLTARLALFREGVLTKPEKPSIIRTTLYTALYSAMYRRR